MLWLLYELWKLRLFLCSLFVNSCVYVHDAHTRLLVFGDDEYWSASDLSKRCNVIVITWNKTINFLVVLISATLPNHTRFNDNFSRLERLDLCVSLPRHFKPS
jgi:hypothetical protein